MSQDNPFADPFAPKTQYGAGSTTDNLEDYNPFADQPKPSHQQPPVITAAPIIPATIEPTRAGPPAYSNADANMKQRQEELDRKAEDLRLKEEQLKNMQRTVDKVKNFPPLPKCCCVTPCFYHDISVEIPIESQRNCRMIFYIWQLYVFILLYNFICALALLCTGGSSGAVTFGVALLYVMAFTPCSFVMWYRPVYKALSTDSSFNYMMFFFIFFCQIVCTCVYALGIPSFGTCGWINAAAEMDNKNEGVAAMMFICAALWTILAIFEVLLLKRIHGLYRRSGASMQKAQGEFARDVMTNKNVQSAAAEAVKGGLQSQQGTNTY